MPWTNNRFQNDAGNFCARFLKTTIGTSVQHYGLHNFLKYCLTRTYVLWYLTRAYVLWYNVFNGVCLLNHLHGSAHWQAGYCKPPISGSFGWRRGSLAASPAFFWGALRRGGNQNRTEPNRTEPIQTIWSAVRRPPERTAESNGRRKFNVR